MTATCQGALVGAAIALSTLAVGLLVLPGAIADEAPNLKDLSALEELARRVEREGTGALRLDALAVGLPEGLAFDPSGNTLEREQAFRASWVQAYRGICDAAVEAATELAGDKLSKRDRAKSPEKRVSAVLRKLKSMGRKDPAAAEAFVAISALLPRYEELLRAEGDGGDAGAVFEAREKQVQRFIKRYDFGPKIATAAAVGSAVIDVNLAPDTYQLVERELNAWRFTPLTGADGAPVTLGDRTIEYAAQLRQGAVREALAMLQSEYFVVRYSKMVNEKAVDLISITGAKLLFGTYYFIEHGDRIVVVKVPQGR